jgi:hypothetical protein
MPSVRSLRPDALVERVRAKLETEPYESRWHDYRVAPDPTSSAAYALIVGAGFSHGVVPLVRELMHETIGGYYIPDQEQSSMERPTSVLREHAADFWAEFNAAAAQHGLPVVAVDGRGLPEDPAAAYQYLFTYQGANALFALTDPDERTLGHVEQLQQRREARSGNERRQQPQETGERFMKGFLRYVMDIGSEAGYGSTGRSDLNPANIYLAALLEAQQTGLGWNTRAFCRTILTTNFDTLLQHSLQMVNLLYAITDRPEKGLDRSEFVEDETVIHLVYTHGSILRHNPANTVTELGQLSDRNVSVLREYLASRDIITIGYSGWSDGLMAALRLCDPGGHDVYCCDVRPEPRPNIAEFLRGRADHAAYVQLGREGADGLLHSLYQALVSKEAHRDPMQRFRQWNALRRTR